MRTEVVEAAQRIDDRERVIINYAKSDEFTREGLADLLGGAAPKQQETP